MITLKIFSGFALLFLAACGGGGGGETVRPVDPIRPTVDTANLEAFSSTFLSGSGMIGTASAADLSPLDNLPTGSVVYTGVALMDDRYSVQQDYSTALSQPGAVGDLLINANFGENTVNGSITNLISSTGRAAVGSINIGNGTISDGQIEAPIAGVLTLPVGSQYFEDAGTIVITGSINMTVRESNGSKLYGTLDGTTTGGGGRFFGNSNAFLGVVAAER